MTNPEIINTIGKDLSNLSQRLSTIQQEGKDSMLYLLNNLEENKIILMKIKNNQIITKKEYTDCFKFLEICRYSRPASLLDKMKLIGGSDHSDNMKGIYPFVKDYPFVVDADEVREDISSLIEDGIAEIWKNGKRGLVKKTEGTDGEKGICTLFDHNHSQSGALTFSQDEYDKYGLIEVINHKVISQDSYNIMFLQREKEPLDRFVRLGGNYHMLQDFDRDGIGFNFGGLFYTLLHKDMTSEGKKIYEIMFSFKSAGDDIKKGFDSFNTFEAEMKGGGKVTFKKSYDGSGKLNGIYAFKKKRFGGEEQVRARDKEH